MISYLNNAIIIADQIQQYCAIHRNLDNLLNYYRAYGGGESLYDRNDVLFLVRRQTDEVINILKGLFR